MGKPYQSEISALPKTILWALQHDIAPIEQFIADCRGKPLISTGSGGSLSAAKVAALLHEAMGGGFAKTATPLELASRQCPRANASFIMVSAGGKNTDSRMVFRHIVSTDPERLLVLTARLGSPIGTQAKRYSCCTAVELDVPAGRDGFLATNSLIAFTIIFARAFSSVYQTDASFNSLKALVSNQNAWRGYLASLCAKTDELWKRKHLIILYSPDLEPAAVDMESKFTEAALSTTQTSDFRHFAHGRHHWLAKQPDTAVLAIFTPRFGELATRTLSNIPESIPKVQMPFSDAASASLVSAMLMSVIVAGFAGTAKGIDPGRPGVPPFGRRIYHLNWTQRHHEGGTKLTYLDSAIRRKVRAYAPSLECDVSVATFWRSAGQRFCHRLKMQKLKGLVLDYDGTLVFTARRFESIPEELSQTLISLLDKGIALGVASGRGKSLKKHLRSALPKRHWSHVILGYYNGSQVGFLGDDSLPEPGLPEGAISELRAELLSSKVLAGKVAVEERKNQLSVVPSSSLRVEELWTLVQDQLGCNKTGKVHVVRSGHSVDITNSNTSKEAVVTALCHSAGIETAEVLRIGDNGQWPGNDAELLSQFPSLSVDGVSAREDTCWNLAPVGLNGPQALGAYLAAIKVSRGGFSFDPLQVGKRK
jgi:hydroxymethylpyrimidine pyrophosphatase-like HAD family hydrolase/fructoselysine-6-P-deglycase FrlB-like protein